MNETASRPWIDFQELKGTASVPAVLDALGLLGDLVKVGSDWKGQCPFHKGEGNIKPFSFHEEKRAFHCFACKRKGSILDFVSQYLTWKGESTGVRKAAEFIVSAMENYTPLVEKVQEEEPPYTPAPQEEKKPETTGKERKPRKRGAKEETKESGEERNPILQEFNQEYFLDFIDACKLVSLNKATARDFIAVRASFLDKLRSLVLR